MGLAPDIADLTIEETAVPLDPAIAAVTANQQMPPLSSMTPQQVRDGSAGLVDLAANARLAPMAAVSDTTVDGAVGPLPARVYRPGTGAGGGWTDGARPTLVWFHGGGWVIGDIDTLDLPVRMIAARTGAVVVSVAYRLAPEDPFPAPVLDALAATRWVRRHAGELGGDPARVVVGGDSAGGNLAAVVARELHTSGDPADHERPPLAAQLLVYPATDLVGDHPSRAEHADAPVLKAADGAWFAEHYVGHLAPADLADPRVSPLLAPDLTGLPPAVVATAEFDPLLDEGVAYAEALRAAGVPVRARTFAGLVHGYLGWTRVTPAATAALHDSADDLVALLRG